VEHSQNCNSLVSCRAFRTKRDPAGVRPNGNRGNAPPLKSHPDMSSATAESPNMRILTPLVLVLAITLVPLAASSKGGGGHGGDGGNSSIVGATAGGGPVGGSTTGSIGTPIPNSAPTPLSSAPHSPLANGSAGTDATGATNPGAPNGARR
jgi:hypothetical protein